jgi:hypothetical protein
MPQQTEPPVANPEFGKAILQGVDEQLASGEPPEVRATLERLVAEGYTREGARQLIGNVLIHEIYKMMTNKQPYDNERYIAALARLPELPEDDY